MYNLAKAVLILKAARNNQFSSSTVVLLKRLLDAAKDKDDELCKHIIIWLDWDEEFKEWADKNVEYDLL